MMWLLSLSINLSYKGNCTRFIDTVSNGDLTLNPSKSVILIFVEDTCPDDPLMLGTEIIQVKKGDCHIGIYIGQDKGLENEFLRQRINCARKAFFAHKI